MYHRTGVRYHGDYYRFGEVGWYKDAAGHKGLVAFQKDPLGSQYHSFTISPATHTYQCVYNPSTYHYHFYYDGIQVAEEGLNFVSGDSAFAGGEVANCVEAMGNVAHYDNMYCRYVGGSQQWSYYYGFNVEQSWPYSVVRIDDNNWRATGNEY